MAVPVNAQPIIIYSMPGDGPHTPECVYYCDPPPIQRYMAQGMTYEEAMDAVADDELPAGATNVVCTSTLALPTLNQAKAARKKYIRGEYRSYICRGFVSNALGTNNTYPMDDKYRFDQLQAHASYPNGMYADAREQRSAPLCIFNAYGDHDWVLHTMHQINIVIADTNVFLSAAQMHLHDCYAAINAATTVAQVLAVVWTSPVTTLDQMKDRQFRVIKLAYLEACVDGFVSNALGTNHTYPMDYERRIDIIHAALVDEINKTGAPIMCKNGNGTWSRIAHTQLQCEYVLQDCDNAIDALQEARETFFAQIAAATSIAQVQAVAWVTPPMPPPVKK